MGERSAQLQSKPEAGIQSEGRTRWPWSQQQQLSPAECLCVRPLCSGVFDPWVVSCPPTLTPYSFHMTIQEFPHMPATYRGSWERLDLNPDRQNPRLLLLTFRLR